MSKRDSIRALSKADKNLEEYSINISSNSSVNNPYIDIIWARKPTKLRS